MAIVQGLNPVGILASADLSSHQYKAVDLTSGKCQLAGADARNAMVLLNKPAAADDICEIASVPGTIVKIQCGAAVSAGAFVTPNASGLFITATTGQSIKAQLLDEAASASGSVVKAVWIGQSLTAA